MTTVESQGLLLPLLKREGSTRGERKEERRKGEREGERGGGEERE